MITPRQLHQFSSHLNVLYVEDDDVLRQETIALFEPFFHSVDSACNGKEGLERYNQYLYDLVITDINMPEMNGIEMIKQIHEVNPDQKVIVISAYNDSEMLLKLIREGINSFILKPMIHDEVLKTLYPVCRDARTQQINNELFDQLRAQREELERQLRLVEAQNNAVSVKHRQVEQILAECPNRELDPLLNEYFRTDEDQGAESVLFHTEDCEEMLEVMNDGFNELSLYSRDHDTDHIIKLGNLFRKMASILYLYTPFLDPLAKNMEELGGVICTSPERFIEVFSSNQSMLFTLFDAIKIDMERYIKRFSAESMAMKNIHHIHEPTSMSIRQVIALVEPELAETGEIDFF